MNGKPGLRNFTILPPDDNLGVELSYDLFHTSTLDFIWKILRTYEYYPWVFSLIGSILVGLSGILPLLIIPIEEGENLKTGEGAKRLKVLLSFAVGGLLGDVFLHLLPEAWEHSTKAGVNNDHHPSFSCGLWVLIGMLVFVIVEKLFSNQQERPEPIKKKAREHKSKTAERSGGRNKSMISSCRDRVPHYILNSGPKFCQGEASGSREHYHISGYLNLMANSIDNFTHGLAIGGSFCISFKIGVLSTFAILIHEIPHEVGDFAILLKSGFSRWDAAKAQICTASAGIFGSMLAVGFGSPDSIESKTSWILPFTAGGFLHIALVTVLPELVKEESKVESLKQIVSLILGIVVMALLIFFLE